MSIVLQSSGGGSVTIQEPVTASNLTATLPAATGTVMVSGNMPAFSAYANASTSCANGVATKIIFQSELFDTANCFDTSNSRFTPNVSGYYQVNTAIYFAAMSTLYGFLIIKKNGGDYAYGSTFIGTAGGALASGSCLVNMNGTTDYMEIYAIQLTGTSQNSNGPSATNFFQASLVRTA